MVAGIVEGSLVEVYILFGDDQEWRRDVRLFLVVRYSLRVREGINEPVLQE